MTAKTTTPHLFLLTTTDNPLSPFSDWVAWYLEDIRLGHDTCGLLARLTSGNDIVDDEAEVAAMRDVVTYNFSGKHVMVVPEDYSPFLSLPD
ncbi:hypothetical protein KAR91_58625 [Candidatus Pacearchaeota archaeon]|nr:hypothetical protein [Candidatus Pacearchaeota archaeon]